ncbi:MAG TPA: hypothetical protein VEA18_04125 [Candidatus Kapabacteria bacterium]|nr:hypothetical protein [Candidatus Kapabacteria bacterium]
MTTLGPHYLYEFCLHTEEEVSQALLNLVNAKETMLQTGIPIMEDLYEYIEPLASISNGTNLEIQKNVIHLLNPQIVDLFLKNPNDVDVREMILVQVVFLVAATGVLQNVEVYTEEKVLNIVQGKERDYDDINFLTRLYRMYETAPSISFLSQLIRSIPTVSGYDDVEENHFWDDVCMFSLFLHILWKHFSLLRLNEQQILIQNTLYQSVVLGISIRESLERTIRDAEGKEEQKMNELFHMCEMSKEHIIVNTVTHEQKNFSEIIRLFLMSTSSASITALAREKFITDIYKTDPHKEIFCMWLREVLLVISQLRTKTLI